jgi:hypothetical protein
VKLILIVHIGLDGMEERAALVGITGVDTVFCVSETYTQVGDCRK